MDTSGIRWRAVADNPCKLSDHEAAAVGDLMLKLQRENGKFSLDAFVRAAKYTSLRCYFTWDDHEAATQYRLLQADKLIRCVRVEEGGSARPIEAVVQMEKAEVETANVRVRGEATPEERREWAIEALIERLMRLLPQLEQYPELAGIADAITATIQRIGEDSGTDRQTREAA